MTEYGQFDGINDDLVQYHTYLADTYRELAPFAYPRIIDASEGSYYEQYQRSPFTVRIGKATEFPSPLIGAFIDGIVESYTTGGLYPNFPQDNALEKERLVAALLDGFGDPMPLVIAVCDKDTGMLIGGCMVQPGAGDMSVYEGIGNAHSTLPTLAALTFTPESYHPILDSRESECVCYARFFHLPHDQLIKNPAYVTNPSVYLKRFSMETLSGMVRGTASYAIRNNQTIRFGILDTHDSAIINTLTKYYGAQVLSSDTNATDAVSYPNPHHWHYDAGNISVIVFDQDEHLNCALQTDNALGPKDCVDF